MWEFIWQHMVSGLLNWMFSLPWYIWAIPAGVLIGIAWKLYRLMGWQGIAGALLVIITVGAYRQGWNTAVRSHKADGFTDKPKRSGSIFRPASKRPATKRKYNRDLNVWEEV